MNHTRLISLTICFILLVVLGLSVSSFADNDSETNTEAEQHLETAYELRKATDYNAAIAEYEKVISLSPNSKIAQNAQYWIGQSYFESKQFDAALSAFQGLLDKYPASSIALSTRQMIERVQQAKKNKSLFEAVEKGDIEQVKSLIAAGADVNGKDANGETVLNTAISKGHKAVVELLIANGADVNAIGRWDAAPLHDAAWFGHKEIAQLLLDKAAHVNILQGESRWTPLHSAADQGKVEVAKVLIANGADLNAKSSWSSTPLYEAIWEEHWDMARLLVDKGADVNFTSKEDWPPLYYALSSNDKDLVELMISKGSLAPAFHLAAFRGNLARVQSICAEGTDVNSKDQINWTPLHWAVSGDQKDIAEFLIGKGADINAQSTFDETPLLMAAYVGSIESVELLLSKGAGVNMVTSTGSSPLHCAAKRGNVQVAKILIAHGANIEAKNNRGQTPLFRASIGGNREMVELLIAKGADLNTRDSSGRTALIQAKEREHGEIVELLRQRGAKETLQEAVAIGNLNELKGLISEGYDVNSRDSEGQTPLHLAASRGQKEMAEVLVANGANVNLKDKNGRTPLLLAAESAYRDVVIFLLDKGAEINATDGESGFTALHHSARFGDKNAAEVLIARGADLNAKDKQGHTPLYVAVNHDYKVAEFLINKGADSTIRTESDLTLLQLAQQRKQIETPDMIFEGEPNSVFGSHIACVDVDGDGYEDILVGDWRYNNHRGRVYLFYGGPDMDTTADLIFTGQNEGDYFGNGIACGDIDNDGYEDIVIAASRYSENRGRAYLFWGSDRKSMDAHPDKIFDGEAEKGAEFGACYPAVYDIDNDGYDDIILGACHAIDKTGRAGRAYLYFGNTKESMDTSADLIFKLENPEYSFGYTIRCGDIDNDGFGDIVVGGYARAHLYYGASKSNMDAKADVILKSKGNDRFSIGIACVDQNRDGYDDVVIGAPGYNDWHGRAYLFYGSSRRNIDTDPDIIFDGEVENSRFGYHGTCGDIDGDKVNDIVIGAYGYRQQVGRVYVYWGKEMASTNPKPGRILTGNNPNDTFGFGLACGDINNDGFDDLVIGACGYGYKAGRAKPGRVYLYYGGPRNKEKGRGQAFDLAVFSVCQSFRCPFFLVSSAIALLMP